MTTEKTELELFLDKHSQTAVFQRWYEDGCNADLHATVWGSESWEAPVEPSKEADDELVFVMKMILTRRAQERVND